MQMTHKNPGVNSGVQERSTGPALHVIPILLPKVTTDNQESLAYSIFFSQYFNIIVNLYIFPLMSLMDIVNIDTDVVNISLCDVKHIIMTVQIRIITPFLKFGQYTTASISALRIRFTDILNLLVYHYSGTVVAVIVW